MTTFCAGDKSPAYPVTEFFRSLRSHLAHVDGYGAVENHLTVVFITLGEPQAHGDTAEKSSGGLWSDVIF
jgi:hypothetical protein